MLEFLSPHSSVNPTNYRPTSDGLDEQQISAVSESNPVASRRQQLGKTPDSSASSKKGSVQISVEAREIARLETRDREVRTHEAAHAAVGGQYAGSPSLTYTNGPDGRSYATGGEVSISVSAVSGDPLTTLQKAEIVRAAALAPTQPSAQDMRVASRAAAMAAQARADLATKVSDEQDPLADIDESEPAEANSDIIPRGNRVTRSTVVS